MDQFESKFWFLKVNIGQKLGFKVKIYQNFKSWTNLSKNFGFLKVNIGQQFGFQVKNYQNFKSWTKTSQNFGLERSIFVEHLVLRSKFIKILRVGLI